MVTTLEPKQDTPRTDNAAAVRKSDRTPDNESQAKDLHYGAIGRMARELSDLEIALETSDRLKKFFKKRCEKARDHLLRFIKDDPVQMALPGFEADWSVKGIGALSASHVVHDKELSDQLEQNNIKTVGALYVACNDPEVDTLLGRLNFDEEDIERIKRYARIAQAVTE